MFPLGYHRGTQTNRRDDRPAEPARAISYNMLVVEDDPIIGILLVDILLSMGHQVCALKTTAADAVMAAFGYNPDMMMVDVRLGSGSGIAAVAQIRRIKRIPYMYMTGALIPVGQPCDVVLYKPFVQEDIEDAIQRVVAAASP
jgi:CheY-like chemotaxis protein